MDTTGTQTWTRDTGHDNFLKGRTQRDGNMTLEFACK